MKRWLAILIVIFSSNVLAKNDTSQYIGYYEGELIYPNGEKLSIYTEIYKNYSKLFGDYSFKDFDGSQIKGKLTDFKISGEWIEAKWRDSYGNGWLKVNYRNNKFQGSWGLFNNGKYEIVGRWTGFKKSKQSLSTQVNIKEEEKLFFKTTTFTNAENKSLKDEYYGEIKNEKSHGVGRYIWRLGAKDENTYIGNFRFGKMHGYGVKTNATGSNFCGRFITGRINNGILTFDIREGDNDNKERDKLIGDMTPQGFGIYYFVGGNFMVGEWQRIDKNSDLNGYAIKYYKNGKIHEEGKYTKDKLTKKTKIPKAIIDKTYKSEKRAINSCNRAKEIVKIFNINAGENVSLNSSTVSTSNSKYIYCKDTYGVHKYLKSGNCYDGETKISEKNYLDLATYCEKKNGEIYISQNNNCKSSEKKSSKFQYNKKKNNIEKKSQDIAYEFDTKIEYILNKVIDLENRIKLEISDLKNFNKNFNSKSSKNLGSSEYYFNQEIDKISKEINDLEKEILDLKVGNLIKNKIKNNFKKISNETYMIYILISKYTDEYDQYIKKINNKDDIAVSNIEEEKKDVAGIYYTTANVNFRDNPRASNSSIISTIKKNSPVEVLRFAAGFNDWVQIKYNNNVGYLYFPYLTKIEPEIKTENINENMKPEEMMQLALDILKDQNYEKSKEILLKIIEMYPENQLSGSAYFWLARIYQFEENFRKAAIIFGEGVQKFPNSIKAPEMWYNLSEVLVKLNKIPEACTSLSILNKRYENNTFKTMAEESIKKLSCQNNETSKKKDTKKIDEPLTEQEQALVNLYYAELKKLYDLIDMQLITNEDYINRKELIINQIINLKLKNISHFLIQLLAEQLITTEEFEILNNNNIFFEKNEEKKIKTKDNNDLIELSELFKDLKNNDTNIKVENKIDLELTISELDIVMQQLRSCFNPRAGTQILGNEMVKVRVNIDKQANVRKDTVQIIDTNISKSNPYYKAITESAVATLYNPLCSKLKLPLNKYELWKTLTITIDYNWLKN